MYSKYKRKRDPQTKIDIALIVFDNIENLAIQHYYDILLLMLCLKNYQDWKELRDMY